MRLLDAGALLGDFRLDRLLDVSQGIVTYEATQLSLGRRVAVRLPDPARPPDAERLEQFRSGARAQATLRHPGVVGVLAAGDCEHGPWVATSLVPRRTLRALLRQSRVDARRSRSLLEQVAQALDAAHAAGLAHGALSADTVLIGDGERALITDLRPARDGCAPSADDDRRAFAALARDLLGDAASVAAVPAASAQDVLRAAHRRPRRPARYAATAVAAVAALAAALLLLGGGEGGRGGPHALAAPAVAPQASALGSDLAAGAARAVSCDGGLPDPSRPVCTVLQTRLAGRRAVAPADGVVRRWAVRGARGELALVVAREGRAGATLVARSQTEVLADERPRAFQTELPVRRGDRIGVELGPGAAIGVRGHPGGAGTRSWLGTLRSTAPLRPGGLSGRDMALELLVRADVVAGATFQTPARLVGPAAARAAVGRIVRRAPVPRHGDEVVLVRLGDDVALDLLASERRLARIGVPGADADGRPDGLRVAQLGGAVLVTWRNPDGRGIVHEYRVQPRALDFAY
jgi:hypothetical protein